MNDARRDGEPEKADLERGDLASSVARCRRISGMALGVSVSTNHKILD